MLYVNPVSPLLNRTAGMTGAETAAQRKQALQEFERLYVYGLLKEMRQSTTVSGEKKGREMQLFEEMLDDALAGEMSRSGQVGIAKQIEQQMAAEPAVAPGSAVRSRSRATGRLAGLL
jgi:Rod binding domain-containing protein